MVDNPALDPDVEITNVIQRETTTPLFIRRTIPALEKEIEIKTVFAGETLSLRYRLCGALYGSGTHFAGRSLDPATSEVFRSDGFIEDGRFVSEGVKWEDLDPYQRVTFTPRGQQAPRERKVGAMVASIALYVRVDFL
jgi:hypothetical protein